MIVVVIPGGPAIRFESRRHGKSEKRRLVLGALLGARGGRVAVRRRLSVEAHAEAGALSSRNEEDPG